MAASTYLAGQVLNWVRGTSFAAAPSDVFVSLHNGDPGLNGANEVTTNVRAAGRVAVPFGSIVSKRIENDDTVDYGTADAGQTVSHFGIWDASSGGNFLGGHSLQTTRVIAQGDPVVFLPGDLSIQM